MASNTPNTPAPDATAGAVDSNVILNNTNLPVTSIGSNTGIGANGIKITECVLSDASWPSDLTLDLGKSNWQDWRRCTELLALKQGFKAWLDGSLQCSDGQQFPSVHWVWQQNDDSLRGFLLDHISPTDYALVANLTTSHNIFKALRKRHEDLGLYAKVNLLMKALNIRFNYNTPLSNTIAELHQLHHRIIKMGKINDDELFTVFLVNALGDQFAHLQSAIQTISASPGFSSGSVVHRIEAEESLIQRRTEQGLQPPTTTPSAFLAVTSRERSPKPTCTNCKRLSHLTDYCVAPGGKMYGRTLDEARPAQRAALAKTPQMPNISKPQGQVSNGQSSSNPPSQSAHIVTAASAPANAQQITTSTVTTTSNNGPLIIHGVPYIQDPSWGTASAPIPTVNTALLDPAGAALNYEYQTYVAIHGDPHTTVDWTAYSTPVDLGNFVAEPIVYSASLMPALNVDEKPFVFDSGATCHVSPEHSDFKNLSPIQPQPVKGLGGTCIYAIGQRSIDFHVASGHTITLNHVLYIPGSTVWLMSVLLLNHSGSYTSCFDASSCWVLDKSNTLITRGYLCLNTQLYKIPHFTPCVAHSPRNSPVVHYVMCIPTVKTWHRRLGHCDTRKIINMACSKIVEGMPIDLSTTPPKCDHCILGKQSRASVPKV